MILARELESFVVRVTPRIEARIEGRAPRAPDPNTAQIDRELFEAWLQARVSRLDVGQGDLLGWARAAVGLARGLLVSQRQTRLTTVDSIAEAEFFDMRMLFLVSGLASCEMINYLVCRVLEAGGVDAQLFETGERELHEGSHLLVHARGPEGGMFVDGWSAVPWFWLESPPPDLAGVDEDWGRRARASRRPDGVPTHAELAATHGRIQHGLYPATALIRGRLQSTSEPPRRGPPAAIGLEDGATEVGAVWTDYVDLRRRDLLVQLLDPAAGYARLAARREAPARLRTVATALARRRRAG